MTSERRRAVLYLRISEDRTGEGAGVERQLKAARARCAYSKWTIVAEYLENDTSAAGKVERAKFRAVLEHLNNGTADVIVGERVDRLTRNGRDRIDLLEAGKKAGALLACTAGSDMDLATADGRMSADLLAAIAQGEIEKKGERQRNANAARAGKGIVGWTRRPFGYDVDAKAKIVIVRPEAAAIRRAAKHILAGGTLAAEVRDLNAQGLMTTAGKPFNVTTVRRILLNPRYAGVATYNGVRQEEAGKWPAILKMDTHEQLSEILNNPRRLLHPGTELKYLLSGSVICGVCGERMFASPATTGQGKRHMIYKCFKAPHLGRRLDLVDEVVTQVVLERLGRPDAAALLVPDVDLDALRAEATSLRRRRDDLAELLAEGLMSKEAAHKQATKLTDRLTGLDGQISAARATSPALALAMAGDVPAKWKALPVRTRREIVDLMMTVTILPVGRGSRWDPYDLTALQILGRGDPVPADSSGVQLRIQAR